MSETSRLLSIGCVFRLRELLQSVREELSHVNGDSVQTASERFWVGMGETVRTVDTALEAANEALDVVSNRPMPVLLRREHRLLSIGAVYDVQANVRSLRLKCEALQDNFASHTQEQAASAVWAIEKQLEHICTTNATAQDASAEYAASLNDKEVAADVMAIAAKCNESVCAVAAQVRPFIERMAVATALKLFSE